MKLKERIFLICGLTLMTGLLSACPGRESISRINGDPARFKDKDVIVAGTVVNGYGALGKGIYEIDDGTGTIWVVTEHGLPSKGSRVGIQGRIQNGVSFGGRNYGIAIYEDKRRSEMR